MDSFASAIKNQHSFNKMIESQIAQLAAVVPPSDKGKILGYTMPEKKSDLGRPVIPITIGPHIFEEAIYDFGANVNIMPKVIYDQINSDTLLYINMCLQLVDQSLCYPKGTLLGIDP